MKVTFLVEELKQRLSQLTSVVARKSQEALYRNVRLFTENGSVYIQGIDIDITMTLKLAAAKAEGEVDFLTEFSRLSQNLAYQTAKEITITCGADNTAVLAAGRFKTKLVYSPSADLIALPLVAAATEEIRSHAELAQLGSAEGVTLGLPGLIEQVEQVQFAVPKKEGKHVTNVVLIAGENGLLKTVASDGSMVGYSQTKADFPKDFAFTVPQTAIELLTKMNGGTVVEIWDTDSAFFFRTEIETITHTKTHGEFPPYQRILPPLGDSRVVFVLDNKVEAASLLNRVSVSATEFEKDDPSVFVDFDGKTELKVLAIKNEKLTTGDLFTDMCEDVLPVASSNDKTTKVRVGVNRVLAFFDKAVFPVTISVKNAHSPIDLHANGGTPEAPTYRFLLMPMRMDSAVEGTASSTPQEPEKK